MQEQIKSAIRNNKLFRKVNESGDNLHLNKESILQKGKGEIIYKEGETSSAVFLVLKGEVLIYKDRLIGKSKKATVSEGDFFGEEEFLQTSERKYSASASEDSLLYRLSKDDIRSLMNSEPAFISNIKRTVLDETGLDDIELDNASINAVDPVELSIELPGEMPEDGVASPGVPTAEEPEEQQQMPLQEKTETSESDLYFRPAREKQTSDEFLAFDDIPQQADNRTVFQQTEAQTDAQTASKENAPKNELIKSEAVKAESAKTDHLSTEQLKLIMQAAQLVNSNIKIDDVLESILDAAKNLTDAERGTLYLIDKEKDELWSKVIDAKGVLEIRLKIGEGIAGWVAKNKEILNIKDVSADPRFNGRFDRQSGFETKNMLCFPVQNKEDEVVGVLQLINNQKGEFTKTDEEFLSMLSIHAALALENAGLVERLLQTERVTSLGKMANFLIQDIKKPVLVSKRYAEHLKTKDLTPDVVQVVDMLLDQLNHVADIVQSTSSYSEGKTLMRSVVCNLNETLDEIFVKLESNARIRNCSIVKQYDRDVVVKLDRKEFALCCMHIVRNACDAMPDGGKVIVSTKAGKDFVKIYFRDFGLGIPDSIKDKIFEPFMSHGKKDGTGLGLSVTRKVVEDHGGQVEVESDLGEGATFIITLPTAR